MAQNLFVCPYYYKPLLAEVAVNLQGYQIKKQKMLIKIKGRNQERFQETLKNVMNLACVAFRKGSIPTQKDMQEPERTGLYWYENKKEGKFELLPTANNHKAFIRSRGENFIVIEFYSRYDRDNKQANSLSNLVLSFFDEDEVEAVL